MVVERRERRWVIVSCSVGEEGGRSEEEEEEEQELAADAHRGGGAAGVVISFANAVYRRIWHVALKSPLGSAVAIKVSF